MLYHLAGPSSPGLIMLLIAKDSKNVLQSADGG